MGNIMDVEKLDFMKAISRNNPNLDVQLISKAYDTARIAHSGKNRKTGEPFFTHPRAVALLLSAYCNDTESICAALLHDVVEDTDMTLEQVEAEFGPTIKFIVDGVTKVYGKNSKSLTIEKVMSYGVRDARVLYLKLVDKIHNLETLHVYSEEKQQEIMSEVKKIYIPEAEKLGFTEAVRLFGQKYSAYKQVKNDNQAH